MTSTTIASPVEQHHNLVTAIRGWQTALEQTHGSADGLTTELYICQECGELGAVMRYCSNCGHDTKKIRALITYGM